MKQSGAPESLSELLGRLAAEFNRTLGSVSREAFSYEAEGRAIVLEIVQFGHAALNSLAKTQASMPSRKSSRRSRTLEQTMAEGECADCQIVALERTVPHAATACVYLLYVLCGDRQPAWIVHGLCPPESLDALRSDMEMVISDLAVR